MPRKLDPSIDDIVIDMADLVKKLVGPNMPLRSAAETINMEQGLAHVGREMADRVMEVVLRTSVEEVTCDSVCPHAPAGDSARPRQSPPAMKSAGLRTTSFMLLGGRRIALRTQYRKPDLRGRKGPRRGCGRRGPGGVGQYPRLARLGIVAGATPATLSEIARHVADAHCLDAAQEALARRGLALNRKTVIRLAYRFAEQALRLRAAHVLGATDFPLPASAPLRGKRVVACVDGGRTRIRSTPRGRRRKKRFFRIPGG